MVVTVTSPRIIYGTPNNDVIAVTGGLHEVHGGAGNDTMCADSLGTTLLGDDGNDTLIGGAGNDRLFGGNGNDLLLGGGGADLFVGGAGTDTVSYADHHVPVTASINGRADSGASNEYDLIDVSNENLVGGSSTNVLTGDSAPNVLTGGNQADRLIGGAGNDTLSGLGGNDTLNGQSGHDTLNGGSGVNGCDLDAADTATSNCRFDMIPPAVKSFAVLTPNIDMTAGQTELQLQAEVTDNLSGVYQVTVQFCDAKGNQDPIPPQSLTLATGNDRDGVWGATVDLSPFTPAGRYTVCLVNVEDNDTNLAFLSARKLAGGGALPPGAYAFDIVNNQTDSTAPVISDVVVSAPSVDVTNGAATVTTEFNVVEDRSGIDWVSFGLAHGSDIPDPSNQLHQAQPVLITPSTVGTSGSGRYRAVVALPAGSAAGQWRVQISVRDKLWNSRYVVAPLTVVDRNPITSLPQLISISRTAGATGSIQTFSVHVTSRAEVNNVYLQVRGPEGQFQNGYFELTSGTALDGIWTATIQLPATAAAGNWYVSSGGIDDVLGRSVPIVDPSVIGGGWTVS